MRVLGGAVAAGAVLLALTACGSQASQSTYTPTVTIAPSAPTGSSAASAEPSDTTAPSAPAPSETSAADPEPGPSRCADDAVGLSLRREDSGAGSIDYALLLTNVGGEVCSLRGTPHVSVLADSAPAGPAAERELEGRTTRRLEVGSTASAPLRIVNIGTGGGPLDGCRVVPGTGYRVVLPGSDRAVDIDDPDAVACADGPAFMTVGPITGP